MLPARASLIHLGRSGAKQVNALQSNAEVNSMSETIVQERVSQRSNWTLEALSAAAKLDRVAMGMLRAGLVIVLVWIGSLKFVDYEADSIVPLVANSPVMNFLYHRPAEYRTHMNKEGELNPEPVSYTHLALELCSDGSLRNEKCSGGRNSCGGKKPTAGSVRLISGHHVRSCRRVHLTL